MRQVLTCIAVLLCQYYVQYSTVYIYAAIIVLLYCSIVVPLTQIYTVCACCMCQVHVDYICTCVPGTEESGPNYGKFDPGPEIVPPCPAEMYSIVELNFFPPLHDIYQSQ